MPPRGTFRKFSRPSIGARPWLQGKIGTGAARQATIPRDMFWRPDIHPATGGLRRIYAAPGSFRFFVIRMPHRLLNLACPIVNETETMTQSKTLTTSRLPSPQRPSPQRIERTLTRAAVLLGNLADLAESPTSEIAQVSYDELVLIETRLNELDLDIAKLIRPQKQAEAHNGLAPFVLTEPVPRNQQFGIESVLAKISAENGLRSR